MSKLLLLFIFTFSILAFDFVHDPFNFYIWNKKNFEAQNGKVDRKDWFEWWYYKVVDPQTGEAYFFTYGIVNPWDEGKKRGGTKAVIMAGDFNQKDIAQKEFAVKDFSARYDSTFVKIGDNVATDKNIAGSIERDNGQSVSWDLQITKKWGFNAMGWATGVDNISGIYWYPAQASALVSGYVRFDNKTVQFNKAPGYQDRNWGRTFPKWWTWIVSNHFQNSPDTVFVAGGGVPKIFNSSYLIPGLCIGLKHNGVEYAFRTTDGHKIKFNIRWGRWEIQAENRSGQRIEVSAYAPKEKFMLLPFQTPDGPIFNDYETLSGSLKIKLFEKTQSKWQLVAELNSDHAGIEWGSPTPVEFEQLFTSVGLSIF